MYLGSKILHRYGLDADRFGYLDLIDEVEKMGYSEVKLYYRVLGLSVTMGLREMQDDRAFMVLLKGVSKSDGIG